MCKIETDKVMMVWENVLFSRLRSINSDSLNGESVYSNSMVTEMSSLLANALCMCTYTHRKRLADIYLNITMLRIFHLHIHLLIVTLNMPDTEGKRDRCKTRKPKATTKIILSFIPEKSFPLVWLGRKSLTHTHTYLERDRHTHMHIQAYTHFNSAHGLKKLQEHVSVR